MPRAPELPRWPGLHLAGIDENGMGPRLGPLVVTSVLARARDEAGAKVASARPRGALARRIGDSKKLVAFDDSSLGEAWARAIVARTTPPGGAQPSTPGELLSALALDAGASDDGSCAPHHAELCGGTAGEGFVSGDDTVAACGADLTRLEARGLTIVRARVAIVCTHRLNEAVDAGRSRFDVDLHTMERLALAARADAGEDVHALCGKVGGFDYYGGRLGPLAGRLHTVLGEGRARSDYQIPGVGRLSFIRDADDTHLIVGLASLVGKWVRDHQMRRIVRFFRVHLPELPDASGYHDPVTSRFIEATALVRKELGVEDAYFERRARGSSPSGS